MEYSSQLVDGHQVYFSADWINGLENEAHFTWYYHQAKLVYEKCDRSDRILEIGVGTGLLSDMLKKRGWSLSTLDIDQNKHPDHCASALDFDYKSHQIDSILAFEIFEHIPFDTFKKVIYKISASGVRRVCFSLPWNERKVFGITVKLPKLKEVSWSVWFPLNKICTHAHFWELSNRGRKIDGKELVDLSQVRDVFRQAGFELCLEKRSASIQYFSASRIK
jgi:hypothetical protein